MRKRIGTLLVGLLMAVGMAFAAQQQGQMGKGKPTIDEKVAQMKVNLNLTDQQAAQVKELLQKHQQEKEAWQRNNPNPTQEQIKSHREQMWNQMDKELKKILTPEQYKKHQEMRRQAMKHGPKGPPKK